AVTTMRPTVWPRWRSAAPQSASSSRFGPSPGACPPLILPVNRTSWAGRPALLSVENLADFLAKRFGRERLVQERDSVVENAVVGDGLLVVPGHIEHAQRGTP